MEEQLKCPNCGSQEDVVTRLEHVGGVGITEVITCRNRVECWCRWDEQHNLVGFTLEKEV